MSSVVVFFLCCCTSTSARSASVWNHPARAGITTTFRVESYLEGDWEGAVRWWAKWHCDLVGFEKIYMFADSKYTVDFVNGLQIPCVEAVPSWEWRVQETEDDLHDFTT